MPPAGAGRLPRPGFGLLSLDRHGVAESFFRIGATESRCRFPGPRRRPAGGPQSDRDDVTPCTGDTPYGFRRNGRPSPDGDAFGRREPQSVALGDAERVVERVDVAHDLVAAEL